MKDYLLIQDTNTGLGQIAVSYTVISEIVTNVIDQDKNVFFDEIRGIKSSPTITLNEEGLSVFLKVRIQYGQDVEKSIHKVQTELRNQLELMVGYHDPVLNFSVVGFKFN